jgi:hypothetical protein
MRLVSHAVYSVDLLDTPTRSRGCVLAFSIFGGVLLLLVLGVGQCRRVSRRLGLGLRQESLGGRDNLFRLVRGF